MVKVRLHGFWKMSSIVYIIKTPAEAGVEWRGRDSNPQPSEHKSAALPLGYPPELLHVSVEDSSILNNN